MTIFEITVQPSKGVSHFDVVVPLEGVRYSFAFYTNTVDGGWYFDLINDQGAGVRGLGLVTGVDMLYPYRHLDLPPGELQIRDKGLNGADPDLEAFADGRAALYYITST